MVKSVKGQRSKEGLTVVLCVNMCGKFEKPYVIGKSQRPRCFKNIQNEKLPVIWRANRKAFTTGVLFLELVKDVDRRMRLTQRKCYPILRQCSITPNCEAYKH